MEYQLTIYRENNMKVDPPGQTYCCAWLTEKECYKLDIKSFLSKANKEDLKKVLKFIETLDRKIK